MNSITMNNIDYKILVKQDNFCDRIKRKLCCNYHKTYKYEDDSYTNITNFVYLCTKYMKNESTQSLLEVLDYIDNSKITLTNLHTDHKESLSIILNISKTNLHLV